jgi:hypothetical protein
VALASAASHVLLVTGFYAFTYLDYLSTRQFAALGLGYGEFLFDRSAFWTMITIFDTTAMAVVVGLFSILDKLGIALPALAAITIAITYAAGTVQWYFLGGGIGALLQRFWSGLKDADNEREWFR